MSEKYVFVRDGTEIYMRIDPIEAPKAVIVFVHGGTGHSLTYNWQVSLLNDAGYSVYRYDQRCHGRSGGAHGFLRDYNLFMDDCKDIVDMVKAENPGKKIFTIGHSMGTIATLGYAVKYPGEVDGQIFTGVACSATTPEYLALDPMKDGLEEMRSDFSILSVNTKDNYAGDPWRLQSVLKGFHISAQQGMHYIHENIAKMVNPCLILHGELDKATPVENAYFCNENISSADKTLKVYKDQPHGILKEESCMHEVMDDIVKWLDARA